MKKILAGLAIVLGGHLSAPLLQAQTVVTLRLANGDHVSGEVVDLNARGLLVRINGEERAFPTAQVAVIEFVAGPLSGMAQAKMNADQPFLVLRSGQVVDGRLSDIGGSGPLRITVDTPGGPRDFSSNDVAQVYVNPGAARSALAGQLQAGGAAPVPAGAITVPASVAWTDSGVVVTAGQRFQFNATGDIMLSSTASSGIAGSPAATVPNLKYPLPGAFAGALIGRIGNGAPFLIGGNAQPIQMRGRGRLMLGVNDDHVPDNSGSFYVTVTRVN